MRKILIMSLVVAVVSVAAVAKGAVKNTIAYGNINTADMPFCKLGYNGIFYALFSKSLDKPLLFRILHKIFLFDILDIFTI